jgi:hypothetical protein
MNIGGYLAKPRLQEAMTDVADDIRSNTRWRAHRQERGTKERSKYGRERGEI